MPMKSWGDLMDLKAVEMQIAIPRTNELGRIQHEGQQRPMIDQSLLSMENVKEHELERQRSSGVDESAHNTTVKREGDSPGNQRQGQASPGEKQEEQEKVHPAEHPYKGRHVDLSF